MTQDAWNDRRRALEESFFMQKNQQLLDQMKKEQSEQRARQALSEACGITDEQILDHLMEADIQAETVAALALVPLVLVAWADGEVDEAERKAVLSATASEGIPTASLGHQLLEKWLETPPPPTLLDAWKDYVTVLREQFTPAAYSAFRSDILGRAEKVAKAAGGLLGLKSISSSEQKVIDELKATFAS